MSYEMESFPFDDERRDAAADRSLMIRQQLDLARDLTPSEEPTTKAIINELFEQFYATAVERNDAITLESWGYSTDEGKGVRESQRRMMDAISRLVDAVLIRWAPNEKTHYHSHSTLFTHMLRIVQLLEEQATADLTDFSPVHGEYTVVMPHVINRMIARAIKFEQDPRDSIMERFQNDFNLNVIEAGILETRLAASERLSKNN